MDPRVRSLIAQLPGSAGKRVVSYGKELPVSQEQVKMLIALNFAFEGRITHALSIIEQGRVAAYTYQKLKFYLVENELVYSQVEACACGESWCRHLLVVQLLEAPLLVITSRPISTDQFVDLVLAKNGEAAALV